MQTIMATQICDDRVSSHRHQANRERQESTSRPTTDRGPPRAGMGHEDAFSRPRLSARCRFNQETFAGTRGNGEDAPKAAISVVIHRAARRSAHRESLEGTTLRLESWPAAASQKSESPHSLLALAFMAHFRIYSRGETCICSFA
jgi:hypothetical protein